MVVHFVPWNVHMQHSLFLKQLCIASYPGYQRTAKYICSVDSNNACEISVALVTQGVAAHCTCARLKEQVGSLEIAMNNCPASISAAIISRSARVPGLGFSIKHVTNFVTGHTTLAQKLFNLLCILCQALSQVLCTIISSQTKEDVVQPHTLTSGDSL